ncbi:hypothetical protein [Bartonella capreoli]|nr:hypothetical protein [Bartonella capreoli]
MLVWGSGSEGGRVLGDTGGFDLRGRFERGMMRGGAWGGGKCE